MPKLEDLRRLRAARVALSIAAGVLNEEVGRLLGKPKPFRRGALEELVDRCLNLSADLEDVANELEAEETG